MPAATIEQATPGTLALSGTWTGREIGNITAQLAAVSGSGQTKLLLDGAGIEGLDTAGAWILQKFLIRLRAEGAGVELRGFTRGIRQFIRRSRATSGAFVDCFRPTGCRPGFNTGCSRSACRSGL